MGTAAAAQSFCSAHSAAWCQLPRTQHISSSKFAVAAAAVSAKLHQPQHPYVSDSVFSFQPLLQAGSTTNVDSLLHQHGGLEFFEPDGLSYCGYWCSWWCSGWCWILNFHRILEGCHHCSWLPVGAAAAGSLSGCQSSAGAAAVVFAIDSHCESSISQPSISGSC